MAAAPPVLTDLQVDVAGLSFSLLGGNAVPVRFGEHITLRPIWTPTTPGFWEVEFESTAGAWWCGSVSRLVARGNLVVFEAPGPFPPVADITVFFRSVNGFFQFATGTTLQVVGNAFTPSYSRPRPQFIELSPRGSGQRVDGTTISGLPGDLVNLVVNVSNDDGRRGNTFWAISGGRIIMQGWDTVTWEFPNEIALHSIGYTLDCDALTTLIATVQVGVPVVPPVPPTCSGVELGTRGSGLFTSGQITTVDQGQLVDLVATIANDDGRRDNIVWTTNAGRIVRSSWDTATWEAPANRNAAVVAIFIDGVEQTGCASVFTIRGVATPPGTNLTLDDILNAQLWQTILGNQAGISQDTGVQLPGLLGNIQSQVSGVQGFLAMQISGVVSDTSNLVLGGTDILIFGLQQTLGATMQQITTLARDDILQAFSGFSFPSPFDIWDTFWAGLEQFLSPVVRTGTNLLLVSLEQAFANLGGPLFARILEVPDLPDFLTAWIQELASPTEPIAALLGQSAGTSMVSGSITGIIAPYLRAIEHWANRELPNVIVGPEILTRLVQRGTLSAAEANASFTSQGLDTDAQNWFLELATIRPDINMLLGFLRRSDMAVLGTGRGGLGATLLEPYSEGLSMADVVLRLGQLGWETDSLAQQLDQRLVLPGIQDLINFAVREAFDPAIVSRFELDADFPEDIVPFAAGQGLPAAWTRMFWRAHWELPAINQAFQMRHRASFTSTRQGQASQQADGGFTYFTAIGDEDLDLLLRTQDVMRFWREPFKDISFNVLSRVDVRRMFDMGIVEATEVELTYLSQGYTPRDANSLRRFVEQLSIQPALTARIAEVRQQFRSGIMGLERATGLLDPIIALDVELAEELITLDLDRDGDRTARLLTAWSTALRKDLVDAAGFRSELTALAVTPEEIDFRVQLDAIIRKTDAPTVEEQELRAAGRGTVQRRFREGLILAPQFRQEMTLLGYTAPETDRFLALATLEFETNLSLDLLAAYRAGLRTNRLSEPEFRNLVGGLNIDPQLVDVYVGFDQLRRRLDPPDVEEQELRATGRGTVVSRFREGWITRPEFGMEMGTLGYTQAETDRFALVADLSFDFDWKQDALGVLRRAFVVGRVTGDDFINRLVTLGMDPGRAQTHLALEQLRLLEREEPEVPPLVALPG